MPVLRGNTESVSEKIIKARSQVNVLLFNVFILAPVTLLITC